MSNNPVARGVGYTLAVIVGFVVVAALSVAAWQIGWKVEEKNVDRRTEIGNDSLGRQQALTDQVLNEISTIRDIDTQQQTPEVIAQREAIVEQMCSNASKLTGRITMAPTAQSFITTECP